MTREIRNAPRRYWTAEELDRLERWYPCMSTPLIACLLQRSERSIYAYANLLGLKKSAFYNAIERGRQGTRLREAGVLSRFRRGLVPWNKGKRGLRLSRATEFKSGHVPANHKPVGSERLNKDRHVEVKIAEPNIWRLKHYIVWEAKHGPVSPRHVLRFRRFPDTTPALSNLECVTRAENMRRNSYHRYPQPIPQLIQLRGALQRQINRRERAQYRSA